MKKEYLIIDAYINNATKKVHNLKTKREIKEELFSHLIEIYERNTALGMSDEDAQKDAVLHMGDSETIAETFKKLYPVSTIEFLKQQGWMIIWPLIFVFQFSDFEFSLSFFYSAFLIMTLIDFKKINKFFNAAYTLSIGDTVLQTIFSVIRYYYIIDLSVNISFLITNHIVVFLAYALVLIGLIKIKKQLKEPKTNIRLTYISILLIAISNALVVFGQINDAVFISSIFAFFVNILPAVVIYNTIKEFEKIDFEPPRIKRYALLKSLITVVLVLAIQFAITNIGLIRQPEVKNYSVDHTQTEVEKIKSNLITLGLPKSIANELPAEEILKYEDAVKLEIVERESEPKDGYTTNILGMEIEIEPELNYTAYAFHLESNNEPFKIRVLCVFDKFERYEDLYRDELFFHKENDDIFCKFLCESEGKTAEIIPFYEGIITDDDNDVYFYNFGFLKNSENFRIYVSRTFVPTIDHENISVTFEYNHSTPAIEANNPFEPYWYRTDESVWIEIPNPIYVEPPVPDEYDYSDIESSEWVDEILFENT